MTFGDNIEEVEIKTEGARVDLLGIAGKSLNRLEIQVQGIDLHNLCDLIGQSKGSTFEVDIEGTIGRLSQNQQCSRGRPQDSRRNIELDISNSKLEVQ